MSHLAGRGKGSTVAIASTLSAIDIGSNNVDAVTLITIPDSDDDASTVAKHSTQLLGAAGRPIITTNMKLLQMKLINH